MSSRKKSSFLALGALASLYSGSKALSFCFCLERSASMSLMILFWNSLALSLSGVLGKRATYFSVLG
jgi:hypothetical protein